jgi:hypothetical protein
MVVLAGCIADSAEPPSVETAPPRVTAPHLDVSLVGARAGGDTDVCALAAELPLDDICSLMCDPTAMAAQMVVDGNEPGTCYQLYCSLPGDAHVLVGVCLPP